MTEKVARAVLRTKDALACLSHIASKSKVGEQAEVTCATALALFNHRSFVSCLKEACRAKEERSGTKVSRREFLLLLEKLVKKTAAKKLFTDSFDVAATNRAGADLVASRLGKVKNMNLKKSMGPLKSSKAGNCISRKSLSLAFGSHCGALLGRNAFSLLEQHYFAKCKPQGRPGWLTEVGSLMGPGALAGGNILGEEVKNFHAQTSCFADLVRHFELGTIPIKRWKRLLREELVAWHAPCAYFVSNDITPGCKASPG